MEKKLYDKKRYESAALSFKEYLKYTDNQYEKDYNSSLTSADTALAKSKAEYGKSGEKLRQSGLLNSGYAAYLNKRADAAHKLQKSELQNDYMKKRESALSYYADYIKSYSDKQAGYAKTAASKIESEGILDFDTAYKLALNEGLNEDNAKTAAENGIKAARDKLYRSVIEIIGKYKYSRARTEIYAKELGFDEKDIKALGDYAYRINEAIYSSGTLIDEIQSQHKTTTR